MAGADAVTRRRVLHLLQAEARVRVAGECESGPQAVAAIREHRPALVFLEVELPELDGFGVLRALEPDPPPQVVFLAAGQERAIQAFDAGAVDFLLKPVRPERLRTALQRALERIDPAEGEAAAPGASPPRHVDRLGFREGDRIFFVPAGEIDFIASAGHYVRVHTKGASHLLRESISALQRRLDPQRFLRIHRSTLVNVDSIHELRPWFGGDYRVLLRDGTELRLSRSYREGMTRRMGIPL